MTNQKDSKRELKPCPFCDADAKYGGKVNFTIVCTKCFAQTTTFEHLILAVIAWNTRPITPKEETKFCECVNPPLISDGRFTNICATCNKPRKPETLDLGMFAVKIASGKYGKTKILEILERIVERAREDISSPPTKNQTERETKNER